MNILYLLVFFLIFSAAETSYLRVLAGNAMVQLAEHWTYSSIMDITQFEQLGLLMQVFKLKKYGMVLPKYLIFFFFFSLSCRIHATLYDEGSRNS